MFTSCTHGAGKKRSRSFRACETFVRCTMESNRGKRCDKIQMRSLIGHYKTQHSIIYNERTVPYWEIGDDTNCVYRGTKMAHRLKKRKTSSTMPRNPSSTPSLVSLHSAGTFGDGDLASSSSTSSSASQSHETVHQQQPRQSSTNTLSSQSPVLSSPSTPSAGTMPLQCPPLSVESAEIANSQHILTGIAPPVAPKSTAQFLKKTFKARRNRKATKSSSTESNSLSEIAQSICSRIIGGIIPFFDELKQILISRINDLSIELKNHDQQFSQRLDILEKQFVDFGVRVHSVPQLVELKQWMHCVPVDGYIAIEFISDRYQDLWCNLKCVWTTRK